MQKLLVFILLLAVVKSEKDFKKYEGPWTGLIVFSDLVASNGCETITFETTERFCKCGTDETPIMAMVTPHSTEKPKIPVISVDSIEEISNAQKVTCKCDGQDFPHLVFFSQNPNYLSMYTVGYPGGDITMLLAKEVPSEKEIENFIDHSADLKGKKGSIFCSAEDVARGTKRKSNASDTKLWHEIKN